MQVDVSPEAVAKKKEKGKENHNTKGVLSQGTCLSSLFGFKIVIVF
jgi:hypothetical protein